MRLAVVIPTLDEEGTLPRLLGRLCGAPDAPEELVVSDGGSGDRTAELARDAGARVVTGARGRGAQLARGAEATSAEALLFLHADTVPAAGALDAVRRALGEGRCAATGFRQRIEARGLAYRAIERAADLRVRALGLVYGDSGLGVARAHYDGVGGFRDLPLFEDLDLSRRLRARGRVRLLGDAAIAVSARRWKGEGTLRRTARNWILTARYALGADPARLAVSYAPQRGSGHACAQREPSSGAPQSTSSSATRPHR